METEPVLRMQGIFKSFPGVRALDDVDFEVHAGEVVALLGENGAGKSTLMKVLAGVYQKDSGRIWLNGEETTFADPHDAQNQGISIIYQEFNLNLKQTVAANIFIGREPLRGGPGQAMRWVDRARMEADAARLLEVVKARATPRTLVRDLAVAERQLVEIAKALSVDARVIIMDEPTSALGGDETNNLFDIIRRLKAEGRAIIFITHRLNEVLAIADRVVVLRDGKLVGAVPIGATSVEGIIGMMVGRTLDQMYVKEAAHIADVVLRAEYLTRVGVVEDVSFELRRGEILGFSGLVGAGRTETARLLFGADRLDSGMIWIDGEHVTIRTPEDAIQAGISLVPEDRANEGLVLVLSVLKNTVLPNLRQMSSGVGWLDQAQMALAAQDYVSRLNIRTPNLQQKAMFLSGGNQQKVVLAKWLMSNPKVLILDEPTRGIDVGAKSEIYALMSQLARAGMGIIMISSEMPEILAMSDRILVMCEGRMTGILDRDEATQERIMALATGHAVEGALA